MLTSRHVVVARPVPALAAVLTVLVGLTVLTGLVGLALASGTAFGADGSISIVKATTSGTTVSAVVSVDAAASDAVSLSSAGMTLDGQQLTTAATPVGDSKRLRQVAILAIDTSGSMRGAGLEGAKSAAQKFLDAVPSSVDVGLVTFADQAVVAVAPNADRNAVRQAIGKLTPAGATRLYDAVLVAARQVGTADLGTVLLLTDGADKGSTATLSQAASVARRSGAMFDAVSIGTEQSQVAPLRTLTAATSGTLTTSTTDAAELSAAFDQTARTISNQFLLSGTLPDGQAPSAGNITVSLTAGSQLLTDVAFVTFTGSDAAPPIAPEVVAPPSALASFAGRSLWLALGALFLGVLLILTVAFTALSSHDGSSVTMRRRLSVYTLTGRAPVKEQETTALGDSNVARSAVELANKVVARRDLETVVAEQLESAGIPLKAAEWMLIHIGIGVGGGLLFFFVFGGAFLPAMLGLTVGLLGPWMYLSLKRTRRHKKFMAQMPDTLQLMAGSLAAGYSMPQAVDTVVREGEAPMATEFNRALIEARLGVPLEDALDGIGTRMASVDFTWVVMAIKIQREVGGNLAEVLNTVAATLRERERLRRQVDVLSAEGRLSAWILGLLPVVFAVYLVLARPEYLDPLISDPLGWILIGLGVGLMLAGVFWLRKVVRVEV